MTKDEFFTVFKEFIQCAVRLNEKAIANGFSSLENEIEDIDNEDFKLGLRLAVYQDTDQEIIDEIYTNMITYEKDEYKRQYIAAVKRAVKGIREGLNNYIFARLLLSFTGGLSQDEIIKIEYSLVSGDDLDSGEDSPQTEATGRIYAKYTFSSDEYFNAAKEKIENEIGENPIGIRFYSSNNKIILKLNCHEPLRVDKIIDTCEGASESSYDILHDNNFEAVWNDEIKITNINKSDFDKFFLLAQIINLKAQVIDENVEDMDDEDTRKSERERADKTWAKALAIYDTLGKANHPEALCEQGLCYCRGTGIPGGESDDQKAAECFRKAAELGNADAKDFLEQLKKQGRI